MPVLDVDGQPDAEPSGRSTLASSFQAGKYRAIPWHRVADVPEISEQTEIWRAVTGRPPKQF